MSVAEPPEPWWRSRAAELSALARGPVQVFEAASLDAHARALRATPGLAGVVFWAPHQPHPGVLDALRRAGCDFAAAHVAGLAEVAGLFPRMGAERLRCLPGLCGLEDLAAALAHGAPVTLRHPSPLRAWPELFAGHALTLQLATPGDGVAAGVEATGLADALHLAAAAGARITGLSVTAPADLADDSAWATLAAILGEALAQHPAVEIVTLDGRGGLAPGRTFAEAERIALAARLGALVPTLGGRPLHLILAAELVPSGLCLARVTQTSGADEAAWLACDADFEAMPALGAGPVDLLVAGEASALRPLVDRRGRLGPLAPAAEEGTLLAWPGLGAAVGLPVHTL